MADLYYITSSAYENLHKLAVDCKFVTPNAQRRLVGLSRFLERLSYRTFEDTRPEDIVDSDEFRLRRRKIPLWAPGYDVRIARSLDLTDEALGRYYEIALRHRITMGAYYTGGPRYRSLTSVTGAVLEAIGCNWLTPQSLPHNLINPRHEMIKTDTADQSQVERSILRVEQFPHTEVETRIISPNQDQGSGYASSDTTTAVNAIGPA